jgi:hypothetical protein
MRKKSVGDWVTKQFKNGVRVGIVIGISDDKQFPHSGYWYVCTVKWLYENGLPMSPRLTTSQAYTLKLTTEPAVKTQS